MIYVNKRNVAEEGFVDLLEKTKKSSLTELHAGGKKAKVIAPEPLEELIFDRMRFSARGTDFDGHLVHTGAHSFPDIIAKKYFGVEVKMTTADKWSSTGNSVLETTRVEDVRRIYLFFAKFGGTIDIKYRLYQECMYDIGVTHSPRYKIDMRLKSGLTIFDKMGVEYDVLRKENNPIRKIKDYYRRQLKDGEELWWIDPQIEDSSVSPVIKSFRKLSKQQQRDFVVEAMILFPEMFGTSTLKFERAAAYLITAYNAVSSNLRDIFTSGGQRTITIKGKRVTLPKIYYHLLGEASNIENAIKVLDEVKLLNYWRVTKLGDSRLAHWKSLLRKNVDWKENGLTILDVFEAGLE